jgi:hypothetical protein
MQILITHDCTWSAESTIMDSAGQWKYKYGEQKYKYTMTGKQSYK